MKGKPLAIGIAVVLLMSCQPPAVIEDIEPEVEAEAPPPETAPPKEEVPMYLKAIPVFPSYYHEETTGALWGIPQDLQGMNQKVKIDIVQEDDVPIRMSDFFIRSGMMYITILTSEGVQNQEKPHYFSQVVGADAGNELLGEVEDIPPKPDPVRVVVNLPGFVIKAAVWEGKQVSEIWNIYPAFVTPETPNGTGPFRYSLVSAYKEQTFGLLFVADDALRFIPQNRQAPSLVAEKGRLWK